MNEIKAKLAVQLVESQKKLTAFDESEKERRKEVKEKRDKLVKDVKEILNMYECGALQGELFEEE